MNNYFWMVALAPLVEMACSNGELISPPSGNDQQHSLFDSGNGQQQPLVDSGNGQQQPLVDSGIKQQVTLPDQTKSSLVYDAAPAVSADTYSAIVKDVNNFGLEVLQSLAPATQNFAVSPISGFIALTMTSDGAKGTTADQMKAVLYPDISLSDIQAATNHLEQRVEGYALSSTSGDAGPQIVLNLANDVFVQKGLNIQQPFLDSLITNYDTGLQLVDFKTNADGACTLINNWVATETNDLIQNLIPPGTLDIYTRLVLVNALYLNASWLTAFDSNSTSPQQFHGINGDASTNFMKSTFNLDYATGTGWVGVDIPYYGGSLVMTAILPDSGAFDTVKANLNAGWLTNFDTAAQSQLVALALPKFILAGSTVSWMPTLQNLGMTNLFTRGQCDLSGITLDEPLYVSDVLQQVYVKVAEKGTIAAAATAVTVEKAFVVVESPKTIPVVFNRPFLFFVREPGGPILFAGQVVSLP
jgi:serpin B